MIRGESKSRLVAVALSKCNTATASIPVLEKALTDDGIKLPKKM